MANATATATTAATVSTNARYPLLECLGIQSWVPRSSLLHLNHPLWGARLGILLSEKVEEKTEAHKVLAGMLSVLMLKSSEYWVGWVKENKTIPSMSILQYEINRWAPQSVLLLGNSFHEMLINQKLTNEELKDEKPDAQNNDCLMEHNSIYTSYHPKELVLHPENKKIAYQQLLNLKQRLH